MRREIFTDALKAALPIMAGYIVLGLPCGLLCQQVGMSWAMVLIMCVIFYSGAGQYMIPNMWLAGNPLLSIILSVSLVNTRQTLYAASLSRYCECVSRRLTFLFGATVTDESFGVNLARFENGGWDVARATLVNLCSQSSWTLACVVGALVGNVISVPTAIASFAMTAIFICLLCMQRISATNAITVVVAVIVVGLCKVCGLSGPAILLGALGGMFAGYIHATIRQRGDGA